MYPLKNQRVTCCQVLAVVGVFWRHCPKIVPRAVAKERMGSASAEYPEGDGSTEFTIAFLRLANAFSEIGQFRLSYLLGKESTDDQLRKVGRSRADDLASGSSGIRFLKDPKAFVQAMGGLDALRDGLGRQMVDDYTKGMHSVTLVLAHGALDTALSGLCLAAAMHSPSRWDGIVKGRKVTWREVKESDANQLLRRLAIDEARILDRKSIVVKSRRLFQVCSPKSVSGLIEGFVWDEDRLARLDRARHDVAHRALLTRLDEWESDLDFLRLTGSLFIRMLNNECGLMMDPETFAALGA